MRLTQCRAASSGATALLASRALGQLPPTPLLQRRAAPASSVTTGLGMMAQLPARLLRSMHTTRAASSVTTATAASSSDSTRPRVCILGGGFGGLYTAIKLQLLMWPQGKKPQITLVDQGERFIFKPLLYELLNGTAQPWEVAPTFAQLLAPYPIQFVQDTVLHVDPEQTLADGGSPTGGVVQLASGAALPYDWLVVALGASADPRGVPGIKQHARPFVSLADAEYVAGRLAAFEARAAVAGAAQQQQATIAVVGAGYAGVELAAVVAERVRGSASVVLLTPSQDILAAAPAGQRQAAEQTLRGLGVTIMTNTKAVAVERVGQSSAAEAEAAAEVPAEAALAAAASGAAEGMPPRPASPEASAVEPLAVLAATAAAATATPEVAGAGTSGSNGASSSSGSSSAGAADEASASYVVKLESAWGPASSSSSASELPADLVLWTAGSQPASRPLQPFPLDDRGQLQTDATLRVLRHTRVFALGDVARGTSPTADGAGGGGFYPATAQVAFQQADYAAWNIWAGINGRPLLPFRYQHLGDMMSLGATNAAVALPVQLPADVSAGISGSRLGSLLSLAGVKLGTGSSSLTVEGPLAQLLRRAAYLYRQPTNEQRLNVAASWLEQAVTAAARLAAEVSATTSSSSSSRR